MLEVGDERGPHFDEQGLQLFVLRARNERFVERVWEWKHEYGNAILDQMKRLGASVDWSREFFTMDERLVAEPVSCMTVEFPGGPPEAERISAELLAGEPSIATVVLDDKLVVAVDTLLGAQHMEIGKRLRELLT